MKKVLPLALVSSLLIFSGCSDDKKETSKVEEKKIDTQLVVEPMKTVQPVDVAATIPSVETPEIKMENTPGSEMTIPRGPEEVVEDKTQIIDEKTFQLEPIEEFKEIEKVNMPDQPDEVKVPEIPEVPKPDHTEIKSDLDKKLETLPSLEEVDAKVSTTAEPINLSACVSCHGTNWEKKALNMSKVVKDLDSKSIFDSLAGYQDGTYGGPMKGVMKGQLSKYSKDDLAKIARQIKGE